MKRISDEDGREASARNLGRLWLSLIPAAFGGAACLWIAAAIGWVDLGRVARLEDRAVRVEKRAMGAVGIKTLPKAKIRVEMVSGSCLNIDSGFMEGDELVFYAKNTCKKWLERPAYAIRGLAHDGTVVTSNEWLFDGDKSIGPSERREQRVRVGGYYKPMDARIEVVNVEVSD